MCIDSCCNVDVQALLVGGAQVAVRGRLRGASTGEARASRRGATRGPGVGYGG